MRATLCLLACFINLIPSEANLAPRGPRPVAQGEQRKSKQCSEKEWPICTDDEWGPKCPSGCRMQGLIETENQQNDDRVKEIRQMLENYSKTFGNTHISVTEAVNRIRQTLNGIENFGDTYSQLVDHLNSRLIILQNRINSQIHKIKLLQSSILEQFKEITRLEVDIDIKIRACKGSCGKSFIYSIDRERNAQMEKNLGSMTSIKVELIQYGKSTHIFKMSPPPVVSTFKSGQNDSIDILEKQVRTFILETSTKDTSETNIFSYYNGATAVPFSDRKEMTDAGGVGSKSSEHHFSESKNDTKPDFTRDSGEEDSSKSILSETYSKGGSTKTTFSSTSTVTETTRTDGNNPFLDYFFEPLTPVNFNYEGSTTGAQSKTKTTTSMTSNTSSLLHTTITGSSSDLALNQRDSDVRTDEGSISSKTQSSSQQHSSSDGDIKLFKSGLGLTSEEAVAHLHDDETGDTDQIAQMLQREQ